jgi:rod shape-determining protein MreC
MSNFIKLVLFSFVGIVFIISIHYISLLQPVEGVIVRALGSVQGSIYSVAGGVVNFRSNWLTKRDLLAENELLSSQLEDLYIEKSKIDSLEQENNLLREELQFIEEKKISAVASKIITGVSDSLSKSVVINRGSNDGFLKGMAVVSGKGVMIGKITEVSPTYSKVLLLTDNNSKVAATIQNLDSTTGLVEGQFGLSFSMTNIPQNQEMAEGDLIVTSGLEGLIPKNLLIARVAGVSQVESEIFKTALLSPIVPLDNLSYVLVIVP